MPGRLAARLVFLGLLLQVAQPQLSSAAVGRWTSAGPAAPIVDLARSSQDRVLYAATRQAVFWSENRGLSWQKGEISFLNSFERIRKVVTHPTEDGVVYVLTNFARYRSSDSGSFWTLTTDAIVGPVVDLQVSRTDPRVIYAASLSAVYRSADGGASWVETANSPPPGALAVDPRDSDVVVAASSNGSISRTTDGGSSWSVFPAGPPAEQGDVVLTRHPLDTDRIYALIGQRLFKSVDGGRSWLEVGHPSDVDVDDIAADSGNTLYAATSGGLFASPDGGHVWTLLPDARLLTVLSLVLGPPTSEEIFAGSAGVSYSSDGGASWEARSEGLGKVRIEAVLAEPVTGVLYATSRIDPGGLFRSPAAGQTWDLLSAFGGSHLASDKTGRLYLSGGLGVSWSDDGGVTWKSSGAPVGFFHDAGPIVVDPQSPEIVYLGACCVVRPNSPGVVKSRDRGTTWSRGFTLVQAIVPSLAIDPQRPEILYAGTFRGLFRSPDGAVHWTPTSLLEPVLAVVIDPFDSARIYASQGSSVIRSTDDASSWQVVGEDLGAVIVSILAHPRKAGELYAGTRGGGVFRTRDGGLTWDAINRGLTELDVTSMSFDSATDTLHVGTLGGVFTYTVRRPVEVMFR
ncbi:MAG TPA: hypothetical protein VNC59_04410 [Thermoanaerobaculia bacterium]|nr:hypothetical protein [Thermoanaerobaculia bacterium]